MNGITFKQSKGVGLIEVLITMLILSTTLITLAALQSRSLLYNHGAYLGSQANILASDILDRIRTNRRSVFNAVQLERYNVAATVFTAGTVPTSSLADRDVYIWRQNIESQMPGGTGAVECSNSTGMCTVTITWVESNTNNVNRFTYTSRL